MACLLSRLGARTWGLGLEPATSPSLFTEMAPWEEIESHIGDIRSAETVAQAIRSSSPEIVIHLASQAIVKAAFADPYETFSTNVAGTVNLLQQLRAADNAPRVILVVTTDKVYGADENGRPFAETDSLDARDPYGASKVGQELAAEMFRSSYFDLPETRVATARSGNVIGGGDWAEHRLVPDFFRARNAGQPLELRNPAAVRPWQHILDVCHGYLTYVEFLWTNLGPLAMNFAPPAAGSQSVQTLVERLGGSAGSLVNEGSAWPETSELRLDARLANRELGWHPILDFDDSTDWTREWYEKHELGSGSRELVADQVKRYLERL
jgi:CDP-glucose 4,6-dehydratase